MSARWHAGLLVFAFAAAVLVGCGSSASSTDGAASGGNTGSGGLSGSGGGAGAGGLTGSGGKGGAAGSGAGGSLADAGADAGCQLGCTRQSNSCTFSGVSGTMWLCTGGNYDVQALTAGGCKDMATGLPRYCCPSAFTGGCP